MAPAQPLPRVEPKPKPGDPCIQCGGERKFPAKRHRAEAMVDPFCSSVCCRLWHGVDC